MTAVPDGDGLLQRAVDVQRHKRPALTRGYLNGRGGGGVIRNMIGVSLLSEGLELGYVRKRTHDRVACVWRREGRGGRGRGG